VSIRKAPGWNLAEKLERALNLLSGVIDQTRRRVINGEKVPASEKIASFFEFHSDIIEKGNGGVEICE
jgi:IS5 family transposase